MRKLILTAAVAVSALAASVTAEATPAMRITPPGSSITMVEGGCGPGGHRNGYGRCVPNFRRGGYGRACPPGMHLNPYGRCRPNF